MLVPLSRRSARPARSGFTLLEVLVVVAILVILASVAGVYVFGYLEQAKVDTARTQCAEFENACVNFATANGGNPPGDLGVLVRGDASLGIQPLMAGGERALYDPWGKPYQYNGANYDTFGNPDPVVYTSAGNNTAGAPVYSPKHAGGQAAQ